MHITYSYSISTIKTRIDFKSFSTFSIFLSSHIFLSLGSWWHFFFNRSKTSFLWCQFILCSMSRGDCICEKQRYKSGTIDQGTNPWFLIYLIDLSSNLLICMYIHGHPNTYVHVCYAQGSYTIVQTCKIGYTSYTGQLKYNPCILKQIKNEVFFSYFRNVCLMSKKLI